MKTTGCRVESLAGHHEDGWCAPIVRGLIHVERACDTITFTVWMKEERAAGNPTFFLKLDGRSSGSFRVPYGEPFKLYANRAFGVGDQASFEIVSDNKATGLGEDQRRLSFVLSEIEAV